MAGDRTIARGLDFGLFFFGVGSASAAADYRLIIDLTVCADRAGLKFVSVPERHFHPFGGAFPSPATLSAALAQATSRVQLRAGSVITPLHDIVRVAEDWSVVDNLSNGRVALSLGSGWSANDFVLASDPDAFEQRRDRVRAHVDELRHLWGGGTIERPNAAGQPFPFTTFPRPVQTELPIWLTAGGSEETFVAAGRLAANVLTHLERQSVEVLEQRVEAYRAERARWGHDPAEGVVTLMQHTLIGPDGDAVRAAGREHLGRYIAASLDLEARTVAGGGTMSGGSPVLPFATSVDTDRATVVATAVDRYQEHASLIGTVEECRSRALGYLEAGVDEIACLVDFVDSEDLIRAGISGIAALQGSLSRESLQQERAAMIAEFNREPG